MAHTLLKCPFCGGEPLRGQMLGVSTINCLDCGVRMESRAPDSAEVVMRVWNRRAGER